MFERLDPVQIHNIGPVEPLEIIGKNFFQLIQGLFDQLDASGNGMDLD